MTMNSDTNTYDCSFTFSQKLYKLRPTFSTLFALLVNSELIVFERHYFIRELPMGRARAPSAAPAAAQHAHPPPLLPPRSLILILLNYVW